jgi:hypothetical protein
MWKCSGSFAAFNARLNALATFACSQGVRMPVANTHSGRVSPSASHAASSERLAGC